MTIIAYEEKLFIFATEMAVFRYCVSAGMSITLLTQSIFHTTTTHSGNSNLFT